MAAIGSFFMLNSAQAELLTGEARLACEAVLCLSSSERPSECNPALSHYFGIKRYRKGHWTGGKQLMHVKHFLVCVRLLAVRTRVICQPLFMLSRREQGVVMQTF